MSIFVDPLWGKLLIPLVLAMFALTWWFSLHILLYFTKRDFINMDVQIVHFTRHDHGSRSDKVRFKGIDNMKLRTVIGNHYLFLVLIACAFRATKEKPVLSFGTHEHTILSLIRRELVKRSANSELKRAGGLPFVEVKFHLCVVYDLSEDRRYTVMRSMLVQERDLNDFEQYLQKRPDYPRNFSLVSKIHDAYVEETGSFIDVEFTAA